MTYTVLITAPDLNPKGLALLDELGTKTIIAPAYSSEEELAKLAADNQVDGIIVRVGQLTKQVIDASPKLRVLSKGGIGVDNVDVDYATSKGIVVCNTRYSNSQSVAEHALGMTIAALKDFVRLDQDTRNGGWEKATYSGTELAGKHVGLIGYGGNGRAMAKLLKAFGCTISVYDPYLGHNADFTGVTRCGSIDEFLGEIDVLSIHCPRTKESLSMIDRPQIAKMKPSAVIVNCARGGIVNEDALLDALTTGKISAAGIDVFLTEPPAKDHPFFKLDNIIVSPHVAGVTDESGEVSGVMSVENVYKILDNKPIDLDCVVNPDALPKR